LKFSFKLVTFSKSYARKQKWVFFSEYSVHDKMQKSLHVYTEIRQH